VSFAKSNLYTSQLSMAEGPRDQIHLPQDRVGGYLLDEKQSGFRMGRGDWR
jgi:hypothetical protein